MMIPIIHASEGEVIILPTTSSTVLGTGAVTVESFPDGLEDDGGFSQGHVTTLKNTYPLKLMVPYLASRNHCIWVYPIIFGGGLVGGDGIDMVFNVKQNCAVLITGQQSTKVYLCDDKSRSYQNMVGSVEQGGLLCVLSDPVVCYKDSDFTKIQTFHVNKGGNLVYLDWLIGGRVAHGELWQMKSYRNQTDIYVEDTLVYRNTYTLCDAGTVTIQQAMKSYQVYLCGDEARSYQNMIGSVEQGELLCVLSDPVVCYKDSDFNKIQTFHMNKGGNLVYLDWLIGGRVALGELWQMKSYQNQTDIYVEDTLVYRNTYTLCDAGTVTIQQAMKSYQVVGWCIILGNKLKDVYANLTTLFERKSSLGETNDSDVVCSISPLQYDVNNTTVAGVCIRFMASTSTLAYNKVVSYIAEELDEILGGNPFEGKY